MRVLPVGWTLLLSTIFGGFAAQGADTFQPAEANAYAFAPQTARFVRVTISATNSGNEPCLDEFEVFAEGREENLALASAGARASASSCWTGLAIHTIEHLNDGVYGNSYSWVAGGTGDQWAQIELPAPAPIARVVLSRDRNRGFGERVPAVFAIGLSMDGQTWTTVREVRVPASPVDAASRIPSAPPAPAMMAAGPDSASTDYDTQLRQAFLGEEHAWLKTYGRADLDPGLVPYNGRVKEYPRHVDSDRLPLPPLEVEPKLDARLGELVWEQASRGVERVAALRRYEDLPLVDYAVRAGWRGPHLYLAIETNRLLSAFVAVVSSGDASGMGVVVLEGDKLVFNTYGEKGKVQSSTPIEGAVNRDRKCFEFRLPESQFPGWREKGLRIGLGLGGKHVGKTGRAVEFMAAPLALADCGPAVDGQFHVGAYVPRDAVPVPLTIGGVGEVSLQPGKAQEWAFPEESGPIGPRFDWRVQAQGQEYALHLFRYDPAVRSLSLMQEMLNRMEAKGLDVREERTAWESLSGRHAKEMHTSKLDVRAERGLLLDTHLAKRALFLRDPDLATVNEVLFEKRQPFRPSHNYSDYFDAPFRPGGGVFVLRTPFESGRLMPEEAVPKRLFDAQTGIARNPAADFELKRVYFGYRPSEPGYYHLMAVNTDGSGLQQISDGPFHDFWPCPLPDGGLAFISTRCTSRVFCWRPQSSTLFRMTPDGGDIRPVSLANLTEWAPSMMNDGRLLWTRWEYVDKGADFGHTLWSIRPDGTFPELVFGNTIIQPNGYVNGTEVPGTREICCTLISHFGDLNGPLALIDTSMGPFDPKAIKSITPEVPWPGAPPAEECFREAVPVSRDLFLCSHAPGGRFDLYLLDRYGNRELLYSDPEISSMCPTLFRARQRPPVVAGAMADEAPMGELVLSDVYQGLGSGVPRGSIKYLRVVEEVRHGLDRQANGEYPKDHEAFMQWYASPDDLVTGPYGWPTYVAKASLGLVPVEPDGSAHFRVPAGKVLYFQALDSAYNEIQRMRSVVQLQPGERRGCIGCHESRQMAPPSTGRPITFAARAIEAPSWGARPFSYEREVQPVLDAHCVSCHDRGAKLDLSGVLDKDRIPASYRTLISQGWVHYADCGWNSGGCEKLAPMTFGTLKSKLWELLNAGHHEVQLTDDETLRLKTWIDLNCPLWPDYVERDKRQLAGR